MRKPRSNAWLVLAICVVAALALLLSCAPSKPGGTKYTEYKIGMTAPRSGDASAVGDQQVAGPEVAVEEINAKGGIDGVPVKLIIEDNQAKPTMAVTALQKLITVDKVPLALTTYSTAQLAQVPIADQNEVVMINTGASSTELINSGKYIFHVQPNSSSYLRVGVNYMVKDLKQTGRWASLYINDAMGRSFNLYVKTLLPKYGIKDYFEDNYETATTTDFRGIIAKAMAFKPDIIFQGGIGNDMGTCIKQLREAGFKGPILCAWGGGLVSDVSGLASVGVYYAEQIYPDTERMRVLKDKLLNQKKLPYLGYLSVNAYDSLYVAATAIKYAKDTYGGDYFTGPMLWKAIREKKDFTDLSTPGTIDLATQSLSRQLAVKTWKVEGGKLQDPVTLKEFVSKDIEEMPAGEFQKKS